MKRTLKQTLLYGLLSIWMTWCGTTTARAQYAGGDGSQENPYQIATAEQLRYFATQRDEFGMIRGSYQLTADIDLQNVAWTPIDEFRGHFDGQGHVIKGLLVNQPNKNYLGFFGRTIDATIQNVGFEGNVSDPAETPYTGGIIGLGDATTISRCYFKGEVQGKGIFTGGLAGSLEQVESNVGIDWGIVDHSYFDGQVKGNSHTGGLVGRTLGLFRLTRCYVNGKTEQAGLVGEVNGEGGEITDCFLTGTVATAQGALVGSFYEVEGNMIHVTSNCTVKNSHYLPGRLSIPDQALYGKADNAETCAWISRLIFEELSKKFTADNGWKGAAALGDDLTAQERILTLPTLFDETAPKAVVPIHRLDVLTVPEGAASVAPTSAGNYFEYTENYRFDLTPSGQYLLKEFTPSVKGLHITFQTTPEGRVQASFPMPDQAVTVTAQMGYAVTTEIYLNDKLTQDETLRSFVKILDDDYHPFSVMTPGIWTTVRYNTEEGNRYIHDCDIMTNAGNETVPTQDNSTPENIHFIMPDEPVTVKFYLYRLAQGEGSAENPFLISNVDDLHTFSRMSALGYEFPNSHIRLTQDIDLQQQEWTPIEIFKGHFDGGKHVIRGLRSSAGGFFGRLHSATITQLGIEGKVTHNTKETGGLANDSYSSDFSHCFFKGEVSGTSEVGGLFGYQSFSRISNSYCDASVTGTEQDVGGLIGLSHKNTLTQCYVNGLVKGPSHVGGLIGNKESDVWNKEIVERCYVLGRVEGENSVYCGDGDYTNNVNLMTDSHYLLEKICNKNGRHSPYKDPDKSALTSTDLAQKMRTAFSAENGWTTTVTGPESIDSKTRRLTLPTLFNESAPQTTVSLFAVSPKAVPADGVSAFTPAAGTLHEPMEKVEVSATLTGKYTFKEFFSQPEGVDFTPVESNASVQTASFEMPATDVEVVANFYLPVTTEAYLDGATTPDASLLRHIKVSKNGIELIDPEGAAPGEQVCLEYTGPGVLLTSRTWKVVTLDGDSIPVDNDQFVMPEKAVKVQLHISGVLSGEGTAEQPYLITSGQKLKDMATLANHGDFKANTHFRVTQDLELSNVAWPQIEQFEGHLDGGGHVIKNMHHAFFNHLNNSSVRNLGMEGEISNEYITASLALSATNVTIDRCYFKGNIEGHGPAAGLVNTGTDIHISNSYVDGNVKGRRLVGGLVGETQGTVLLEQCYVNGDVSGQTNDLRIGGLVGTVLNNTTLRNCFLLGKVKDASGALVGTSDSTCNFTNSHYLPRIFSNGRHIGVAVPDKMDQPENCVLLSADLVKAMAPAFSAENGWTSTVLRSETLDSKTRRLTLPTLFNETAPQTTVDLFAVSPKAIPGDGATAMTPAAGTLYEPMEKVEFSATSTGKYPFKKFTYQPENLDFTPIESEPSILKASFTMPVHEVEVVANFYLSIQAEAYLDGATTPDASLLRHIQIKNETGKLTSQGTHPGDIVTLECTAPKVSSWTWKVVTLDGEIIPVDNDQFVMPEKAVKVQLHISGALSGEGTVEKPYLITSAQKLRDMATWINSGISTANTYFKLTQNLDLKDEPWTPIELFEGHFEGGGHSIKGILVQKTDDHAGFFDLLNGATIQNLGLEGNISGHLHSAGLALQARGTQISQCYFRGNVQASLTDSLAMAGGLIQSAENCQITNTYLDGDVKGHQVGGLIGQVYGQLQILRCYVNGRIEGDSGFTGGLIAENWGTLKINHSFYLGTTIKGNCAFVGFSEGTCEFINSHYLPGRFNTEYSKRGMGTAMPDAKDLPENCALPSADLVKAMAPAFSAENGWTTAVRGPETTASHTRTLTLPTLFNETAPQTEVIMYLLTVKSDPEQLNAEFLPSPGNYYEPTENIQLSAKAPQGYYLNVFVLDTQEVEIHSNGLDKASFLMPAQAMTVTAQFKKNEEIAINCLVDGVAAASLQPDVYLTNAQNETITVANPGEQITLHSNVPENIYSWIREELVSPASGEIIEIQNHTFTMPKGGAKINVYFHDLRYQFDVESDLNGVSDEKMNQYVYLTDTQNNRVDRMLPGERVTIHSDAPYYLYTWIREEVVSLDNGESIEVQDHTFVMPKGKVKVKVFFEKKLHPILSVECYMDNQRMEKLDAYVKLTNARNEEITQAVAGEQLHLHCELPQQIGELIGFWMVKLENMEDEWLATFYDSDFDFIMRSEPLKVKVWFKSKPQDLAINYYLDGQITTDPEITENIWLAKGDKDDHRVTQGKYLDEISIYNRLDNDVYSYEYKVTYRDIWTNEEILILQTPTTKLEETFVMPLGKVNIEVKVNTGFEYDSNYYQIIDGTARFVRPGNPNAQSCSINHVTYAYNYFELTQIASNAFEGMPLKRLDMVNIHYPPALGKDVFKDVDLNQLNIEILAPSDAERYLSHPQWKDLPLTGSYTVTCSKGGSMALEGKFRTVTLGEGENNDYYPIGNCTVRPVDLLPGYKIKSITLNGQPVGDENGYVGPLMPHDVLAVVFIGPLTLTDGKTAYTKEEEWDYTEISYVRNYGHTKWMPLYLPFAVPVDEELLSRFDIARLNDVHQHDLNNDGILDDINDRTVLEIIRMKAGMTTRPNWPYMIRAKSTGEQTITVKDAKAMPATETQADCSSTRLRYTFQGNYHLDTPVGDSYVMAGGGLKKANAGLTIGAYRWFMTVTDRQGYAWKAPRILLMEKDENGQITAFEEMEMEKAPATFDIYDLNGRPVRTKARSTEGLRPGIYIINGKKVFL